MAVYLLPCPLSTMKKTLFKQSYLQRNVRTQLDTEDEDESAAAPGYFLGQSTAKSHTRKDTTKQGREAEWIENRNPSKTVRTKKTCPATPAKWSSLTMAGGRRTVRSCACFTMIILALQDETRRGKDAE